MSEDRLSEEESLEDSCEELAWGGQVAVDVRPAQEDLPQCAVSCEAMSFLVCRRSYFTLALQEAQERFWNLLPDNHNFKRKDCWLEYRGVPIKMQHPIGLLFDLLHSGRPLPWALTMHFSPMPSSLVPLPSRESVEGAFMTSLKEAEALKHRGAVINRAAEGELKALKNGLLEGDWEQFRSINCRFMQEPFQFVPVKVLSFDERGARIQSSQLIKVPPAASDGSPTTMEDFVKMEAVEAIVPAGHSLLLQGVRPPPSAEMAWLARHLAYPDNFLHFAVVKEERGV